MNLEVLSASAIKRRTYWVDEIVRLSGKFGEDASRIEQELDSEIRRDGVLALTEHLRLCGSIPERYGHDTSEEKLYSKYTDVLLAETYRYIGLTSHIMQERADAADVEVVGQGDLSFVADAKAFRLSRTAKNQNDFKVQAMDGWKRGKPFATVVCPIYQLPPRTSQICQQAIARAVCICSYSHLAVIIELSEELGKRSAQGLLLDVLRSTNELHPSKDAVAYWTCLNRAMLSFNPAVDELWRKERIAMVEGLSIAKEEALAFLAKERERIMRMSRRGAINALLDSQNIGGREKVIQGREANLILSMA